MKGMFSCASKHGQSNPWSSHFAWLKVDLHKLKVSRRWEQKCKVCKTSRTPFVLRSDFEQAVRKMMLSVLEQRLGISCKVDKALLAFNEPDFVRNAGGARATAQVLTPRAELSPRATHLASRSGV